MSVTALRERVGERLAAGTGEAARDQAVVALGQLGAGLGNLVFSLVLAHLIVPGAFAQIVAFLALYTLLGVPGSSISALSALAPGRSKRLRSVLWWTGIGLGAALAVASPILGPLLRLPVVMVVVLGVCGPSLGTLAVERGRLYGERRHARLALSLVAEPGVRLSLGVVLAMATGAVGAAFGVVVAGYVALDLARRRLRPAATPPRDAADELLEAAFEDRPIRSAIPAFAATTFFLLAVIQNQDLLFANRILSPSGAGAFAVVSTLGGIAAFATMTIPLVLLPRVARGRGGLFAALALSTVLGGMPLLVALVAPRTLVETLFGPRYASVVGFVAPYMLAMGLLGVSRVLAAHRCGTGRGRSTTVIVLAAAGLQAALITTFGNDPRAIAFSTLTATSSLSVALGAVVLWRLAPIQGRVQDVVWALTRPLTLGLVALSAAGLAVRFVVTRGLWLDEVTSVFEAREPYLAMLRTLRTADVHPPLYFSILWVTIRLLGSGQLAVRIPSIIAGALVVPSLYLLGKEAYDRRTGIVAAVIGSVAPLMVWYSQEARMYSMMTLFGVLALWAQLRVLRTPERAFAWAVYALASSALAWTQYFGILQILIQQVVFVALLIIHRHDGRYGRQLLIGWSVTALFLMAAAAPLVPFAHQQFVVNQRAGKGFGAPQQVRSAASLNGNHLGIYAVLAVVLWSLVGYHSNAVMALLGALWPLGMLAALAVLGRRQTRTTRLILAAIIVPYICMFMLGLIKRNLFDVRYLSTTVPLLFILVARGITGIARNVRVMKALTVVIVGVLGLALVDQQFNGSNPRRYDFRGALSRIQREAHPGDVLVFDPPDLFQVVGYYAPRVHAVPIPLGHHRAPVLARHQHRVFVLASQQLMGPGNGKALRRELDALAQHGERKIGQFKLANVEVWIYQ